MIWFIVMHLFSTLLDWVKIGRLSEREKDLEILLLCQQLGIVERKLHKPVRVSRAERLTLAVITTKLRPSGNRTIEQLRRNIRIFQPETVLGRHHQLVKRKWTRNPDGRRGRPKTDHELERLVVKLAQENHDWGYDKIRGELKKLGYTISPGTTEYTDYYNTARPHQGIDLKIPIRKTPQSRDGPILRRDVLGGIIHDYNRKAA